MPQNVLKHVDKIAKILTNLPGEAVCLHFAKSLDYYGGPNCATCPLKGKCNNAEALERWLKDEA